LKKILTFALPTERKGKKLSSGCCGKQTEKRLKRRKHGEDEEDFSKLKPKIYKWPAVRLPGQQVLKRDVNVA